MDGDQRYRVDDLARLAGTTVRNVRAYQDRGLLPAPVKEGRVGWYSPSHLARLRLIGELLSRGYNLSNISEMIQGWARGQDLRDVLGLEQALVGSWGERRSALYSREELRELFSPAGHLDDGHLAAAVESGLLSPEGDAYRVTDTRLVEGATLLIDNGVPMEAVLALGAEIATAADHIAALYVDLIATHVVGPEPSGMDPGQVRHLSDVVTRLRPLAMEVVGAALSAALERRIGAAVGEHLAGGSRPEQMCKGTVTPRG